MSGWIVYSKDGSIERCKLRSLEYGGTAMGERAVTATFDYHSEVAFEVFDYIEYRGERFELEAVPTVKKLSSFEYQYELRFVSLKYELERCEMRDLVPSDNGVVYPTPLTFSFTGDVRYLTDRIQACLDAMYGTDVWKIIIADGTSSEEKNITIAQQNCWNALALVNSTYGLSFYIKGRTITIGGEQPLVSHTFEYGKDNGLYEIERASDTETGIVTKLRAYGGTRNLDYSYPKKPEWSDSVLPVSFALSPLRLMLPSFKTDGKTDYVLADEAAIAKYGIREASMVYDDIYPSITGATYNGQAIDEIKAVDAVDESQKTFVVYLHELGFDLEEHLTTSDAQISMKSGALQGYTFTISSIEKQTGGYKITLGKNSLENSEESGAYVPGVNWNMKAGDKFVLLNILMPQTYIRDAENRLLARANEYLAQYSKTNFSYNIGLHDKFLIQNPSVYNSLIEGSKLKVYDKEIGIDEEVTIQSITITENLEDNILPQVKVTLNNEPSASTLDRIQGKLNEVAAETAANGFSTQSELMAQYRKKLDKPFFEKLFVAVDKDGNDIAANDVATPIAYIKAKYHFVSVGGITMYAMDNDANIPSLASGLPFDGRTIWYNPDTQQIEVIGGTGGGSGEGVSNFWDLSGIPSWITNSKPKYTYSEIEGTPDLTQYALASQIPSLSGYATESWVTKQNYATKATTLSGYGITDAYTKTNVDDLLMAYVTLSGSQTITGEKNFTGGLKVNGSPIYYDTEKKYWKLEGDLLVTGGVTMYGNEGTYTPSTIMDAIAVDGTTISKSGGVLKVIGGTGGGVADSVAWANITGKPTWIGSSKPTYSYSEITGAISTTELQNYLTSNSYLNVTEGDNRYLKLSGGTMSASAYIVWDSIEGGEDYSAYNHGIKLLGYNANTNNYRGGIHVGTRYGWQLVRNGYYNTLEFRIREASTNTFAVWKTIAFTDSNVASATKLQTPRTIWGQSFDGTGDVYGDFIQRKYGAYGGNGSEFNIYNKAVSDVDGREGSLRWVFENAYARFRRLEIWSQNDTTSTRLAYFSNSAWSFYAGIGDSMFCGGHAEGYALYVGSKISDANKYLFTVKYAQSTLGAGGNTALHVRGDGNVGVNTDSPRCKFSVTSVGTGSNPSLGALATVNTIGFGDNAYKTYFWTRGTGNGYIQVGREDGNTTAYNLILQALGGNVGVGKEDPQYKVDIVGNIMVSGGWYRSKGAYGWYSEDYAGGWYMADAAWIRNYNSKPLLLEIGTNNTNGIGGHRVGLTLRGSSHCSIMMIGTNGGSGYGWGIAANADGNFYVGRRTGESAGYSSTTDSYKFRLDGSGNGLFYGGVTMYSDQRKKTILNHVELSLKQIANAPLIEHYYNSDQNKTTHVGSIAQYWASMNDWFCKLDSEGFYTMEIQNAALASAISIARELVKYETKTDKAIKKLKKRISELEEEVERLKSA